MIAYSLRSQLYTSLKILLSRDKEQLLCKGKKKKRCASQGQTAKNISQFFCPECQGRLLLVNTRLGLRFGCLAPKKHRSGKAHYFPVENGSPQFYEIQ